MNREIKFRGFTKDSKENKWVYELVTSETNITYKTSNGIEITREVDKETIGQFTGLYDINGKEIYEGDIVVRDSDKKQSDKYIVDFKQGMFVMCNYDYNDISVIALNCYIESDRKIKWIEKSEEEVLNCNKVLLKVVGNIYEKQQL